jgi:hypothetical protein
MRLAAIEQVPHLKRGIGIFRSKRTTGRCNGKRRDRIFQAETTGCQYRLDVGKNSHSRMASASSSDSGVVSTRNAIFSAHLSKELGGGASSPCFHLFIALTDALNGFPIVGAFPFEIRGQRLIQRVGNALSIPPGIVVQLRSTFRSYGNWVNSSRVRAPPPRVKSESARPTGHDAITRGLDHPNQSSLIGPESVFGCSPITRCPSPGSS